MYHEKKYSEIAFKPLGNLDKLLQNHNSFLSPFNTKDLILFSSFFEYEVQEWRAKIFDLIPQYPKISLLTTVLNKPP